jgi:hypothetical protein
MPHTQPVLVTVAITLTSPTLNKTRARERIRTGFSC